MADLLVTAHTPTLGVGRALRTYALARALAVHGPIDLLYVVFGAEEPSPEYLAHPEIRLHPVRPSRGLRRALRFAGARAYGTPGALARGVNAEIGARALQLAPARGEGRVIADGMTSWASLAPVRRRRPVVFNGHNLESSFQHLLGDQGYASLARMQRFERKIFAAAQETWMVSHADVAGARALCPQATVRYVPNVVDVSAITPVAAPARDGVILLVADFRWAPNAEAARFLLDDVMPRVWAQQPGARLALAGRGLELDDPVDGRVQILGYVDDLDAEYARAGCAVVPLLTGGGSPLKFVEALAHAVPVVATPLAAQGLMLTAGEHFLQAEGGEAFARALTGVLRDGARDVARAGRAVVKERYSVHALAAMLAPGAPVTP
jgi:glycosyltransferase involved in cell wall biosynthesis